MALFIFCIFVFSPFFIFSIFYFFLLATGSFFCVFPLFLFFRLFSPLVYVFFSLSKVTRMIGVPLVAKQGSFVYIFWLCSSFYFPPVGLHTQLFTIELFTIDLITCELIYIPIC